MAEIEAGPFRGLVSQLGPRRACGVPAVLPHDWVGVLPGQGASEK